MRTALAADVCEIHYLQISGLNSLSVWLVDPALDPDATGPEDLRRNSGRAVRTGLAALRRVLAAVPEAAGFFSGYNPMIVDARGAAWYIDLVPLAEAARLTREESSQELAAKIKEVHVRNLRDRSVGVRVTNDPEKAAWYARQFLTRWYDIRRRIGEATGEDRTGGNTGAYLIRERGRALLQVFTDVRGGSAGSQGLVVGVLGLLADQGMPLDDAEFYFVNDRGMVQYFATIPGEALAGWAKRPLSAKEIVIRPISF